MISHKFRWLGLLILLLCFPLPIRDNCKLCFLIDGLDSFKIFDFREQFDDVSIDIWTLLLYVCSSDFDWIHHVSVVQ